MLTLLLLWILKLALASLVGTLVSLGLIWLLWPSPLATPACLDVESWPVFQAKDVSAEELLRRVRDWR